MFVCFWPSDTEACHFGALPGLRRVRGDGLVELPPGVLRDGGAKGGRKDGEGEAHLALHHTWEGSWVAWANDVVLKLAKSCSQLAVSPDGPWLVSPRHRIF